MPSKKRKSLPKRSRRKTSSVQGTLRLGLVFVALIGVNVYIFFLRGRTSLPQLMKTSELGRQMAGAAAQAPEASINPSEAEAPAAPVKRERRTLADDEDGRVVEAPLPVGERLARILEREGILPRDAAELENAVLRGLDGTVAAGPRTCTLRFDPEERLRAIEVRLSPRLAIVLERTSQGWKLGREERPVETRLSEVGVMIGRSLEDALKRAGEQPALATKVAGLLAWDLNPYADPQAGDQLKLLVEKQLAGGRLLRYGRVLALEYQGRAGAFRAFWFRSKDGGAQGWFTEHGERLERTLVREPFRLAKSAGFDRHRVRAMPRADHQGSDWPAAAGTPVWSLGDGRVTAVGPRGPLGNVITVALESGGEVSYERLGRFARGLHVGQAVRQKQVIGYVGAAAQALTPSVTLAVKQKGLPVDAGRLKGDRLPPLDARWRSELADVVAPRLSALAAIALR